MLRSRFVCQAGREEVAVFGDQLRRLCGGADETNAAAGGRGGDAPTSAAGVAAFKGGSNLLLRAIAEEGQSKDGGRRQQAHSQPMDLAALTRAKAEHIGLRKQGIVFTGDQSAMFRN